MLTAKIARSGGRRMHEGECLCVWACAARRRSPKRWTRCATARRELNARVHLAHVSTRGALEAVRRAKERGLTVTCEVTPHHWTLTDEAVEGYDTNTKMNPPLRSRDHVGAIIEALGDGTIDAIATDHAPHHADEKELEFDRAAFGITGLETAVGLALDRWCTGRDRP